MNPATAQAISQKILARKMTLNLLNSRLVNHSTLPNNSVTSGNTLVQNSATGQQQQQPLRVTLSSLASPPATSQAQQAFSISSLNPGFTPLQPSNMGISSVPISTANTGVLILVKVMYMFSFHWRVRNATIPCRSQELLPFLSVTYFFLPPFSINYSSILSHLILPSISWSTSQSCCSQIHT